MTETLSELSRQGLDIYRSRLKDHLEPAHNGEFVAIHVPTGDYAVDRYSGDATRQILEAHPPDGQLVILNIGPEADYSLAARYLAGRKAAARRK